MFFNAKNGKVSLDDTDMYYASFGRGKNTLVILPGLSESLMTVKGKAAFLSKPYKRFLDRYTVYIFGRKNKLPEGYSIKDMADDQATAMKALGIDKFSLLGVSQGGMIAQYLAVNHAEMVEKLVIAVSAPYANETIRDCVNHWISLVKSRKYKELFVNMNEKSYSKEHLKKLRIVNPIAGVVMKCLRYDRFFVNAKAILNFDISGELAKIGCPTFIVRGTEDKAVGTDAAYELKRGIINSEMYLYEGLGHAAFEEAKDFNERVFKFLSTEH